MPTDPTTAFLLGALVVAAIGLLHARLNRPEIPDYAAGWLDCLQAFGDAGLLPPDQVAQAKRELTEHIQDGGRRG